MQKFWGVEKMFDGRCENGEHVNNFIWLIFFEILHIKNVRPTFGKISFVQCPFMNCLALFVFFFNGFEINFYLRIFCDTVNSPLTNTSLRRTTPGVGPCHCPVIWLNYALCKGGNLSKGLFTWSGGHKTKETYPTRQGAPTPCKQGLRRTTDTFKTVNDPLRSALGSEKYRTTEM